MDCVAALARRQLVGGACVLAFGGDARSRRLLPREVCHRGTGMTHPLGVVKAARRRRATARGEAMKKLLMLT